MARIPSVKVLEAACAASNTAHQCSESLVCNNPYCGELDIRMDQSSELRYLADQWGQILAIVLANGDSKQFCRMLLKLGVEVGLRAAEMEDLNGEEPAT